MDAPSPGKDMQEKKFNLVLNEKNYNLIFSYTKNDLIIKCEDLDEKEIYSQSLSYESITKDSRYFLMCDTIFDIMNELSDLVSDNKVSISKNTSNLIVNFQLSSHKFKEAIFTLFYKEKMKVDEIGILNKRIEEHKKEIEEHKKEIEEHKKEIKDQKKEIEEHKKEIEEQKKEIEYLKQRLINIEKWKNEMIENKTTNIIKENIIIDSKIITQKEQINFIEKSILRSEMLKDKKITFNLIYQASRDGDSKQNFYDKCNGIAHVLLILRTDKSFIFGGYTDLAFIFHSSGATEYQDNNAFVFSMDKKKIYPVKKGGKSIRCCNCCCPQFSEHTIYIQDKFLNSSNNLCCTASEGYYDGFSRDYELNDGVETFKISELEVFQISFFN